MDAIRDILSLVHPINDTDWAYMKAKFVRESVSKNRIILPKGEVENYLYFIENGVLRTWLERNESEVTIEFSFENTLFSAYTSFLTRTPAEYNVESITNTVLWKINYNDLQDVYTYTTSGQLIGRIAAENLYNEKCKRELALLTQSAEQRYVELFKEQPRLIKEIPLKYIASYIGITPQALSRIRNRIS